MGINIYSSIHMKQQIAIFVNKFVILAFSPYMFFMIPLFFGSIIIGIEHLFTDDINVYFCV